MEQNGQLTCDCNSCPLLSTLASVLSQLHSPPAQVAVDSPWPQDVMSGLHQQCSQVRIALFADAHLRLTLPRVPPPRLEAHVTGCISAFAETTWIFQRQHVRERDQGSHSLNLLQPFSLWVLVLGHGLEQLIVVANAFAD